MAFDELGKLVTDQMPNYSHEWLPLLYLTWYHPSQVNLAYSIIMKHLKHGLTTESTSNRKLLTYLTLDAAHWRCCSESLLQSLDVE